MGNFTFLKNPISKKWIISAPRRAFRPDAGVGAEPSCPFCPGKEADVEELFRKGGKKGDDKWKVRVIPNKFPFTSIHELVLNTPDHHESFDAFSLEQLELIFQTYRERYNEHAHKGQVYIFHNRGQKAGESLPHSHTQLTVVPENVLLEMPRLGSVCTDQESVVNTTHFSLYCPKTSQWPDEVWIAPKKHGRVFGEISNDEIADLSGLFSTLIKLMDNRHGNEFPYNFYIYPGGDWYLRLIPREKLLGGFEVGTGVFVNTQKTQETEEFLKAHFAKPDFEKIKKEHRAEYHKTV
jgi:UDPglucose--hexose-1-phosphate uridylyltransferase